MGLTKKSREHPSFDLSDGRVEVWCVGTATRKGVIRRLESVLSAEEKDRAARFGFERDRDAFIVARGALRMLSGRYLNRGATDIGFEYGAKGKPSLVDSTIEFNVSHTDGIAVFAFTARCPLGVDIERVRPLTDMMDVARRFFCRDEVQELEALSDTEREHAFFLCWTRKEAYVKATGSGLSTPLGDFRVTLKRGEPARFVHMGNEPTAACEWLLHDLNVAPGFAAAIAYRAAPKPIVQSPLVPAEFLFDR